MASHKSAANLNELESKISTLERANFDLKLQLHYLNKKHAGEVNPSASGPEVNINVIEDRSIDVLSLREEVEYSKRRILELESELLQSQLARDKEKNEYAKALQVRPPESAVVEDNRRREREVAMAIAEHDALLIAKLRSELEASGRQRENDKKLIDDLLTQVDGKDEEIGKLMVTVRDLQDSSNQQALALVSKQQQTNGSNGNGGNPMLFSASSDGQQTSITINSSAFAAGGSVGAAGMSTAHGHTIGQGQAHPTSFMIQSGGMGPMGMGMGYGAAMMPYQGTGSRHGDHPSYDALRYENEQLKGRLGLMEDSVRNQQVVIDGMKASASEIRGIEGDEARRLEAELDKCLDEKEKLKQRLQKLEVDFELACRHIKDLGTNMSASDPSYTVSQELLFSPHRNKALAGVRKLVDPAQRQQVEQLEKTVEFYKQREAELLSALEGVIGRCQELEQQQQQHHSAGAMPRLRR